MSEMQTPSIPYDMYESPQEVVIILPLGGVKKDSVEVKIEDYKILIKGEREKPKMKPSCLSVQEECYRGPIELTIDIPPQVYFDKIHSKLTLDNTLQIIVPKALVPEKIALEVEYEST
jgi:HSP20 family molecular chaperone IbpA